MQRFAAPPVPRGESSVCFGNGSARPQAFTLIELLVAMAVLTLFVTVLLLVTDSSQKLWRRTSSSIQMFDAARVSYDVLTRRLSQATLNPYLDYYDSTWTRRDPGNTAFVPAHYGRASDLHFRSGPVAGAVNPTLQLPILGTPPSGTTYATHSAFFFAPLGFTDNNASYRDLPNLLNPVGYYVEFADDNADRPAFLNAAGLPARYRYRLVEIVQPAQGFKGYPALSDTTTSNDIDWITGANGLKPSTYKHTLAENVIAFVVRPEVAEKDATAAGLTKGWNLTDGYSYNSRAGRSGPKDMMQFSQMPPLLRIAMVTVDESAAKRLTTGNTPPAIFSTTGLFVDPDNLDTDIKTLEDRLAANGIQFHTFNSVVSLRAAKWSKAN